MSKLTKTRVDPAPAPPDWMTRPAASRPTDLVLAPTVRVVEAVQTITVGADYYSQSEILWIALTRCGAPAFEPRYSQASQIAWYQATGMPGAATVEREIHKYIVERGGPESPGGRLARLMYQSHLNYPALAYEVRDLSTLFMTPPGMHILQVPSQWTMRWIQPWQSGNRYRLGAWAGPQYSPYLVTVSTENGLRCNCPWGEQHTVPAQKIGSIWAESGASEPCAHIACALTYLYILAETPEGQALIDSAARSRRARGQLRTNRGVFATQATLDAIEADLRYR